MKRALRTVKIVLAGLVLAGFTASLTQGKPELTKKEKTPCITCHTKNGVKDLNEVGKCYEQKRSLEACKVPNPKK